MAGHGYLYTALDIIQYNLHTTTTFVFNITIYMDPEWLSAEIILTIIM